jgi:hypothetical protein
LAHIYRYFGSDDLEDTENIRDGGRVSAGKGVQQIVGQARHDVDDEARLEVVTAHDIHHRYS